jgi:[acyl-carrier-protein] S-malonyltransferase
VSNSVAFLYPGQGAQQVGMGWDLYQSYPEARRIFEQADDVLGFSLSGLCFEGPQEELNRDLNSQLAIYTVSCILTDLLNANNIFPDVVSGYSSGFYAAAYGAGCFDFARGLSIVKEAGEILLDEGRKVDGRMAVIFGLSSDRVNSICRQVEDVDVAILNTPRQTIISGLGSSVKEAMELSLAQGALDAYVLPAAVAYHSRFMKQSGTRLLNEIQDGYLRDPLIPLISYLFLKPVPDKKELRRIMAVQLSRPVLWVDLIKGVLNTNSRRFIEVGPGDMISRTVRWIDRDIRIVNTGSKERLLKTVEGRKPL